MTTLTKLPTPTSWTYIEDAEPPENIWMFLYILASPFSEDPDKKIPAITCGYYSGKTGVFIDENFRCLSEMFEVTHYSVATTPGGEVIQVDPN